MAWYFGSRDRTKSEWINRHSGQNSKIGVMYGWSTCVRDQEVGAYREPETPFGS